MKLETKIFISNNGNNRDLGNIRLFSATVVVDCRSVKIESTQRNAVELMIFCEILISLILLRLKNVLYRIKKIKIIVFTDIY